MKDNPTPVFVIAFVLLTYWGYSYGSKMFLEKALNSRSKSYRYDRQAWGHIERGNDTNYRPSSRFSEINY